MQSDKFEQISSVVLFENGGDESVDRGGGGRVMVTGNQSNEIGLLC